jgi:hypothetical protein
MLNKEMLSAAMRARIAKLKSSLRYSHGLDRSDALADIANCEEILAAVQAGSLRHLVRDRPIGATLH